MKIACDPSALAAALGAVTPACAPRGTNPALSCVKLDAEGDTLTLTAWNTEQGVSRVLRGVSVAAPGACVTRPEQLSQILRETDGEGVSISCDGDTTLVKVGTSRFTLPAYPADEFPPFPGWGESRGLTVPAGVLRTLLARTAFAADRKDSGGRFALTGVLFEVTPGKLTLVATDTKRLSCAEAPADTEGVSVPAGSILIPLKAVGLLERNLDDGGEPVEVLLRDDGAQFRTGRTTVYTRLLEGRYPAWTEVLKLAGKGAHHITLDAKTFAQKVRAASITSDDESKRVDLAFKDGVLTLEARGAETGSSSVEMAVPGFEGEVGFAADPQFLLEFLKAVDAETVELRAVDGTKAVLFVVGDDFRSLIMPLQG